ncbi:MAG TPA: GNAT family N-acetyltransferase [Nocardioidaceae bacterium]|nr:GNAT family N-acetyltransferase [Nocardioidaceae bacterium]
MSDDRGVHEDAWIMTERLLLRRPRADDVDRVFAIHSDARTYRHLPSGRMQTAEQAQQRLDEWMQHWEEHGFGYACVCVGDAGDVVGFAGVKHHVVDGWRVLNLYYRFDPEVWGRGYATEAASAAVERARSVAPDVPVLARVARNNPGSIRVAERLGLQLHEATDSGDPVPHLLFSSAGA